MTDISLKFAKECLENLSEHQIDPSPHFIKRRTQRCISDEWVSDCLLNKKPFRIIKQDKFEDRFRLYYDHPIESEKENLILVIAIEFSTKHIVIITTFTQSKYYKEFENE